VLWFSDMAATKTTGQRLAQFAKLPLRAVLSPVIGIMKGLTDPMVGLLMGQTAENLAHRFGITRAQMDEFAVNSHKKVVKAQEAGHLAPGGGEVEALYDPKGNTYSLDDGVRKMLLLRVKKTKTLFRSQIRQCDARQQLADHRRRGVADPRLRGSLEQHDMQPIGRIVDSEWAGLDPAQMGLGPVHAATPILKRNNLGLNDVDYWEINEAFAAQVLGCLARGRTRSIARTSSG